jgi:hypothetical protein
MAVTYSWRCANIVGPLQNGEFKMPFQREHQLFDVMGNGFVHEHHDAGSPGHLIEREKGASGPAWVWLAFYGFALVTVVIANVSRTASVVLAGAN